MSAFVHRYRPASCFLATGEDAGPYLQSQWSVDLLRPGSALATYGLRLSLKGKVLADAFFLRRDEESFRIVSYDCPPNEMANLLEENVVADEVDFADESSEVGAVSLWGGGEKALAEAADFVLPAEESYAETPLGLIFRGRRTVPANFEMMATTTSEAQALNEVLDSLEATGRLTFADANDLQLARIANGIPAVPSEIGPGELPQEGKLEKVAVDFEKGCYLGQEVMARIHSMGQVQRELLPVTVLSNVRPPLPAELFLGEQSVGFLKSAYPLSKESKSFAGMALLRRKARSDFETGGFALEPTGEAKIFPK